MSRFEWNTIDRTKGYCDGDMVVFDPKVIRLCNDCCHHIDLIVVDGECLAWFCPVVFKKWCECPCHGKKKAKQAMGITLKPYAVMPGLT